MQKEKNTWWEILRHPFIGYVFTIIGCVLVYFESIKSSSYESKKDIAVLQAQYVDIKEDLHDIKLQLNQRRDS